MNNKYGTRQIIPETSEKEGNLFSKSADTKSEFATVY